MHEYNLRIVTSLPFSTSTFMLGLNDLSYDYEALACALQAIDAWHYVRCMSDTSLLRLRSKAGYLRFRDAFDRVTRVVRTRRELQRRFAQAAENSKGAIAEARLMALGIGSGLLSFPYGQVLGDETLEALSARMLAVADIVDTEPIAPESKQGTPRRSRVRSDKRPSVAIYVALRMEREPLIHQLGLRSNYPELFFSGSLNDADVVVFGSDHMGRVPAAVATMRYLQKHQAPDLLMVAGIAGGFERAGVNVGDILIADSIADLGMRKVQLDDNKITKPEFRPREFQTDPRLSRYIEHVLSRSDWQASVVREVEWPDDRRPAIRHGTIASTDEVVASGEWVDRLCGAWPKLLGIEMEAGGVCAAAEVYNLRVAVVRGVSDRADPAKSDDEWRRRAMKTVIHLLASVEYSRLCG
jgi:nucleoside phosphorylase